jgi:hypothetical protein
MVEHTSDVASDANPSSDEGFSGTRTAQIVGISYRQLDYWARTDLIRPSLSDAKGSGSRRRYSYRDLLELRSSRTCSTPASSSESVASCSTSCGRTWDATSRPPHLVIEGNQVVLCTGRS